jgi:hypothetical protein
MSRKVFLAHDPGGYDVTYPVVKKYEELGKSVDYYCVGPASHINPNFAMGEDIFLHNLRERINTGSISFLITGTSWGSDLELRAIDLCKKSNIKTASILDYWTNYELRLENTNQLVVHPDYYIVMDELARSEAIQEGVPSDILFVLGHPGLDRFINTKTEKQPSTDQYKKALFLCQPLSQLYGTTLGYTEQSALEDCIRLFKDRKQWTLHVKFHPKDSDALKQKFDNYSVQGELQGIIPQYSVIIGMNSMGLLHAVLMGIPSISYQPSLKQADVCITNKLGLTQLLSSFEEIVDAIDHFEDSETGDSNRMSESYIWMDGKSTERVYHFLEEVSTSHDH